MWTWAFVGHLLLPIFLYQRKIRSGGIIFSPSFFFESLVLKSSDVRVQVFKCSDVQVLNWEVSSLLCKPYGQNDLSPHVYVPKTWKDPNLFFVHRLSVLWGTHGRQWREPLIHDCWRIEFPCWGCLASLSMTRQRRIDMFRCYSFVFFPPIRVYLSEWTCFLLWYVEYAHLFEFKVRKQWSPRAWRRGLKRRLAFPLMY